MPNEITVSVDGIEVGTTGDVKFSTKEEYPVGYLEMLKTLSEEMNIKRYIKKKDVFPGKAPSWLADEFDIKWIRYTNLFEPGYTFISPYEEFVCRCPLFFGDDEKYDVVIMWVGGEGTDIRLF